MTMQQIATELAKPPKRSLGADENPAAGTVRPAPLQVCGDRLANIGRQGHLSRPTAFAVNRYLASFPIDIFQVERHDFSGPQAQPGEQQ